jgi:hypothetical protein
VLPRGATILPHDNHAIVMMLLGAKRAPYTYHRGMLRISGSAQCAAPGPAEVSSAVLPRAGIGVKNTKTLATTTVNARK